MLWNAKMRFGKTLTALQLVKEQQYNKVLILTHRPVVNDNWKNDFFKMGMPGYQYASKKSKENQHDLYASKDSLIYFVSIQDLNGSEQYDRNKRPLKINDLDIFIRDNIGANILQKHLSNYLSNDNMTNYVSSRKPFGLNTTFKNFVKLTDKNKKDVFKCITNRFTIKYTNKTNVKKGNDLINKWKVLIPRANDIGTELPDDNLNTFVAAPNTVCTEGYLSVGSNLKLNRNSAKNLSKYMHTRFFKFLHSLAKSGQGATRMTYQCIPVQDFSDSSDINWNKSIANIDEQLFSKYCLSKKEIEHIKYYIKK